MSWGEWWGTNCGQIHFPPCLSTERHQSIGWQASSGHRLGPHTLQKFWRAHCNKQCVTVTKHNLHITYSRRVSPLPGCRKEAWASCPIGIAQKNFPAQRLITANRWIWELVQGIMFKLFASDLRGQRQGQDWLVQGRLRRAHNGHGWRGRCKKRNGMNTTFPHFLQLIQVGIVSFGSRRCGFDSTGVYTRITGYVNWIVDNLRPWYFEHCTIHFRPSNFICWRIVDEKESNWILSSRTFCETLSWLLPKDFLVNVHFLQPVWDL